MANLSTIKMRVVIGSVSDPNFAIRNIVLRLNAVKFVQGKTAFFFLFSFNIGDRTLSWKFYHRFRTHMLASSGMRVVRLWRQCCFWDLTSYNYFLILISFFICFVASAWQSTSIACSPPSSSVAFSTILETQEQENTNLAKYVFLCVLCLINFVWFVWKELIDSIFSYFSRIQNNL